MIGRTALAFGGALALAGMAHAQSTPPPPRPAIIDPAAPADPSDPAATDPAGTDPAGTDQAGQTGGTDPAQGPNQAIQDLGTVASASGAILRGLDKIAGTTKDIGIKVGDTVQFGRLSVSLADCRYPAADPTSNAYAQIIVLDPGKPDPLFYGWMVASSPALSALDDPRYDIWVLRCTSN